MRSAPYERPVVPHTLQPFTLYLTMFWRLVWNWLGPFHNLLVCFVTAGAATVQSPQIAFELFWGDLSGSSSYSLASGYPASMNAWRHLFQNCSGDGQALMLQRPNQTLFTKSMACKSHVGSNTTTSSVANLVSQTLTASAQLLLTFVLVMDVAAAFAAQLAAGCSLCLPSTLSAKKHSCAMISHERT